MDFSDNKQDDLFQCCHFDSSIIIVRIASARG